VFEKLTL